MTLEELKDYSRDQLVEKVLDLSQQVDEFRRIIYGVTSERYVKDQAPLFQPKLFDIPLPDPPAAQEKEQISYTRRKKSPKSQGHGRQPLPANLPRDVRIIEPSADTTGFEKIGEKISEQLEYTPGKFYVIRTIRPVYAPPTRDKVVVADIPEKPIEKGIPGPNLLANIITDKFLDHLPIHRIINRFRKQDIPLSASTIDGWQEAAAQMISPVYRRIKDHICRSGYLQADETPLKVRDRRKKGKTHRGFMWLYHSPEMRLTVYDYQPGRGRDGPRRFLSGFAGYLQTDGYSAYNALARETKPSAIQVTHLNCLAHARRNFEKAKDTDERAKTMLQMIQALYQIERTARAKELDPTARRKLRQAESLPVLARMKSWLNEQLNDILPKSPFGTAVFYMLNRWTLLTRYTECGRLEIDNNLVENAVRPVALGRRNYLFAGSHNGARRLAIFYTIIQNAKNQGLNPEKYLSYILSHINTHPQHKLDDLLPQNINLD